ncbi:class I SAM-dependent methyltransferase [Sphingomonas sp.]|jgi:2-polyprenyl-6-hydroxyphenyl methylase/3-demethylubiquinone-9 3-methyltransferase|uniref:class I SAM-dependent methyltransferase n=1 Tax=Sphingomonas sp. TaxID=28214 RepID=UPI002E32CD05|nr:methyltransferase domain-containing protein [Sphingomonas sp.]HEX4695923.1 methyltransferase domain-containing protein [Sphingomonas sp.]
MSDTEETAISWHDSIAPSFRDGYERSAGFRDRLRTWGGLIARYARPGDRAIDAGCGAGTLSFEAAKIVASVEGIDGSPRMIELARETAAARGVKNVSFDVVLFESLSDRAGGYDLVLCSSVLEYLPDLAVELARLAALLRHDGRIIVSLPNGRSRYRRLERLAYRLTRRPRYYRHVRHVPSAAQVRDTLQGIGLSVLDMVYYAEPPLPRALRWIAGSRRRRKTMFAIVAARAARSADSA